MSSKREERERLRQERVAQSSAQGSSGRRRLILGYAVAGVLTVAVIAGLVAAISSGGGDGENAASADANCHIQGEIGVFSDYECDAREGTPPPPLQFGDLEESATRASCELMLDLEDEGNDHFSDETKGSYKTNPPTSGDHYGAAGESGSGAVADGAYLTTPPEPRLVHSMEHGRVQIRYKPDLPEDQQLALKGVFDEDPGGMVMIPDPDLPYAIAVSAWNNAVGCEAFDPLALDMVRNFRDTYRGNGPENFPIDL
jgi:hypothetical protein